MKLHRQFTAEDQRMWHRGYAMPLEHAEQYVMEGSAFKVVGYATQATASRRTGCTFGNEPYQLVVQKRTKSGWGKQLFVCERADMSATAWEQFWELFPLMKGYAFYDFCQDRIARALVEQYGSAPPDSANWFIDRNPYWAHYRNTAVQEREERIYQAKQNRLAMQAWLYRDDPMLGAFSKVGNALPVTEPGVQEKIAQARELDLKIGKVTRQIVDSHCFEDMTLEVAERYELKRKLSALIADVAPYLRDSLGFVRLYNSSGMTA